MVQVVAIIIGCSLLFGVLWFGLEDREVCAASWKAEGLLCTDITHSKKGMHKLIKSAILQDMVVMDEILRICISRSTHNTHNY